MLSTARLFSAVLLAAFHPSGSIKSTWQNDAEFYAMLEPTGVLHNTVKTFISDTSSAEIDRYFKNGAGEPVVVKNAWTPPAVWRSKEAFLKEFGSVRVIIRWPMGTRQLGLLERLDSIGSYVEAMNHDLDAGMVFGSPCAVSRSVLCGLNRSRSSQHQSMANFVNVTSDSTSLSLGPSRQGLPWHNHYTNWEAVASGRKLILFHPPIHATEADTASRAEKMYMTPTREFILGGALREYPKTTHILLEAGDIVLIPCNWWHATVNIGETLAIGSEFKSVGAKAACSPDVYATAQENLLRAATLISEDPLKCDSTLLSMEIFSCITSGWNIGPWNVAVVVPHCFA